MFTHIKSATNFVDTSGTHQTPAVLCSWKLQSKYEIYQCHLLLDSRNEHVFYWKEIKICILKLLVAQKFFKWFLRIYLFLS